LTCVIKLCIYLDVNGRAERPRFSHRHQNPFHIRQLTEFDCYDCQISEFRGGEGNPPREKRKHLVPVLPTGCGKGVRRAASPHGCLAQPQPMLHLPGLTGVLHGVKARHMSNLVCAQLLVSLRKEELVPMCCFSFSLTPNPSPTITLQR
jgi:hypothetical protein